MSNKKFNLKILMLASWVLLFFAWIFFYTVYSKTYDYIFDCSFNICNNHNYNGNT